MHATDLIQLLTDVLLQLSHQGYVNITLTLLIAINMRASFLEQTKNFHSAAGSKRFSMP